MFNIEKNVTNEIIINKSKFITKLIKVNDEHEVKSILEQIKKEYKDATHYCYAYIINGKSKASDDGEPGGTAGFPILNVLNQNNLDFILCVVIRYFGGIKLGAGGLVRAYTNSVVECLNKCSLSEIKFGKLVVITFDYDLVKIIDYALKDNKIINKVFNEKITYEVILDNDKLEELKKYNINIDITKELII